MPVIELLLKLRIEERIAHDPVCLGVQPRHEREVVRERERGEGGQHVLGADPLPDKGGERGREVAVEEVSAEAVEGDEKGGWEEGVRAVREGLGGVCRFCCFRSVGGRPVRAE